LSEEGLCPDCRRQPPAFDYAWAATSYADPLSALIPHYKFHNKTALRTTFGKIIREFLDRYDIRLDPDALVPVPLHPARLRERGYNQAALIAEGLAPALGAPVIQDGLERTRHTPRQSELGQKERFTNIRGAFRITTPSTFEGKHIILVDDLLTTGATASEAARVLKAAGAIKVGVLALSIA
jgi:ComF family protein